MRGSSGRVSQDENLEPINDEEATKSLKTLYRALKGVDNLKTQKYTVITQPKTGTPRGQYSVWSKEARQTMARVGGDLREMGGRGL